MQNDAISALGHMHQKAFDVLHSAASRAGGFTLLELVAVLTVLGIVGSVLHDGEYAVPLTFAAVTIAYQELVGFRPETLNRFD